MKTPEQERPALAERQENADARARGKQLPYPNPWDAYVSKPDPSANREDRLAWHRRFAAAHDPPLILIDSESTAMHEPDLDDYSAPSVVAFRCIEVQNFDILRRS